MVQISDSSNHLVGDLSEIKKSHVKSPEISFKEKAAFAESNRSKINSIITSKNDLEKLAALAPYFIVVDLTWKCNYNCCECVEKEAINRPHIKDLPVEIIEDIFDYSKAHGVKGIMTMGGEVFVYKEGITTAMSKSIQHQIPLKTVTNGSCLGRYIDQIVESYTIPGSVLRISINADRENYNKLIRRKVELEQILKVMKKIISRGVHLYVSTVVFPQECDSTGILSNVAQLENIISDCEDVGVGTLILIPARNPLTKKRYKLNDEEKAKILEISEKKYRLDLESSDIVKKGPGIKQCLDYHPCPAGFLFTLVGSDGKLYKCTDNRGREGAVIGRIEEPGDFEKVWHSVARVQMQMDRRCPNAGCIRYRVNAVLETARKAYATFGINMTSHIIQPPPTGREIPIFI